MKIMIIKFPPPQNKKVLNALGMTRGVLKFRFDRCEVEEKFLMIFTQVILTLYAQGF